MVYLLATIEIKIGEQELFIEALREYVPIVERHGMKLVGSWRTVVGTVPEITDLWAFKDMGHFEKVRQAIAEDPERQRAYTKAQSHVKHETFKLLTSLPFSPIQ